MRGIIGNGLFENIARFYGIARITPSSWRGKCFSEERVESPGRSARDLNRIKVNYGSFVNRLLVSGFRDELREVYGFYVGRCTRRRARRSGTEPSSFRRASPAFAVHFALFANPVGEVMQAARHET